MNFELRQIFLYKSIAFASLIFLLILIAVIAVFWITSEWLVYHKKYAFEKLSKSRFLQARIFQFMDATIDYIMIHIIFLLIFFQYYSSFKFEVDLIKSKTEWMGSIRNDSISNKSIALPIKN